MIALWMLAAVAWAQPLRMQHVANAGVLLTCGEDVVAVDAFFREGVEGYQTAPVALREEMEAGRGIYGGIRVILATHAHRDHFDAGAVARHLRSNARAVFAGTGQLANAVRGAGGEKVDTVTWPAERRWGGVRVRFLKLPHNAPHRDTVENSALVIAMCGETLLFTGDADMTMADFAKLGLETGTVTRLFAPWWMMTGRSGREVIDTLLRPKALWALHGDVENAERWQGQVRTNYPRAVIGFDNRAAIQ
ncbi:MAG: MBL fold metallo-hydrolase [Bryobacterales bacterium]|nr:MBL fold metallo-hydrolase [Bryobacterales bacterium]